MEVSITEQDAVFVFIQARYNSTRLKGKVLMELAGKTLLGWSVDRARMIDDAVKVVVLTGSDPANSAIIEWCKKNNVECFQGSEDDVLGRYNKAAENFGARTIIRLTADNPFVDYVFARTLIAVHLMEGADYSSSKSEAETGLPDGIGVEVFSASTLVRLDSMSLSDSMREHVNDYILENPGGFRFVRLGVEPDFSTESFTVDTAEDFKAVSELVEKYGREAADKADFWKNGVRTS